MIGVISDTHGLVRPQVFDVFQGVNLILHAGDIGHADALRKLETIAPVIAVRGNNDRSNWAAGLPSTQVVEWSNHLFYILHEVDALDLDPAVVNFAAVIFGHSHRPSVEFKNDVLFLNPGSAGPRRFSLPIAVARVEVTPAGLHPEIIALTG